MTSITNNLKIFLRVLPYKKKIQFFVLLIFMTIAALTEILSIASVIPFITIILSPELLETNNFFIYFINMFNISDISDLIFPIILIFLTLIILSGIFRILVNIFSIKFSISFGVFVSDLSYRKTLYQPYTSHMQKNSSEVISTIYEKINSVVFHVFMPILNLFASTILLIVIATGMFIINFNISLIGALLITGIYTLISLFFKPFLKRNSIGIAGKQEKLLQILREGIGGVRDIILDNSQKEYVSIFSKTNYVLRRHVGENAAINILPKPIIETLLIVAVAVSASYVFLYNNNDIINLLPTLGALVLGAQKLLPASQQIYSAWSQIVGNQKSLEDVAFLINQDEVLSDEASNTQIEFKKNILLDNIYYRYADNGPWILKDINIQIKKGSKVGLVGNTGSGKSTLIDIIMGLLDPTSGQLKIDNSRLSNINSWQKQISHVPQTIFLSDASIAENIAFGVPKRQIDYNKINEIVKVTELNTLVDEKKFGLNDLVGEKGIKLSGGQRQRIGIARALYKSSSLLVLDEATNALDLDTENKIINLIRENYNHLTIITISHRLESLNNCDQIIKIKDQTCKSYESISDLNTD